jgi:hypothetical protein
MKMNRVTSVEEFKLISSFETLRKTLLQDRYRDRLEKPLGYWAIPSDRRLPLAFLGRTVGDLLSTPYADLNSTPGIGQKKIGSLVKLLARATRDEPPAAPADEAPQPAVSRRAAVEGFDPGTVSESLWARWRQTVRREGLGSELLGRLAPTLQDLPTVIWRTTLEEYLDLTLDDIRNLKTHGEKRVRVVLEVFSIVHHMLVDVNRQEHLGVRLVPRFVTSLEADVRRVAERQTPPSSEEIAALIVRPLLDQIRVDAGDVVHELTIGRLGFGETLESVRMQSRRLGVTRARVYQLLDECAKAMAVRWPEGGCHLRALLEEINRRPNPDDASTELLGRAIDVFFPKKTTGAEALDG